MCMVIEHKFAQNKKNDVDLQHAFTTYSNQPDRRKVSQKSKRISSLFF